MEPKPTYSSAFIVGCGDIGRRVAEIEREDGVRVAALARSEKSAAVLTRMGIVCLRGDLDDPATLCALGAPDGPLYYFAPPPSVGDTDPRLAALLTVLRGENIPRRIVLISTTGVYGDCGGDWVDESRPPNPQTDRARRRMDAETQLRAWAAGRSAGFVILRVPGIYGPGRLPADRLRRGIPVVRPEQAPYSNRIHADDLARICVAVARAERIGPVYNVSDGNPTTMTDYFFKVADILGLPRPPTVSTAEARRTLSPGMLSFLEESRRIDNGRMLRETGVRLLYPDLDKGLRQSAAEN